MSWFNKLERRFGKYAIHNLMFYIIGIYVAGFIIAMFAPGFYNSYLSLDVSMILKGQIWRIVTFMLQPPSYSLIFIIFVLYFYYMIGTVLENVWGAFKFNVYYFSGVILHILAAFLIYAIFGKSYAMSTYYINLALFMAFAVEQGETRVYLFFLIPVKMKWMGIIDGVIFAITIIGGYLTPVMPRAVWQGLYNMGLLSGSVSSCFVNATCALVSMLNFIVFLLITFKGAGKSDTQRNFQRAARQAQRAKKRQQFNQYRPQGQAPGYNNGNNGGNGNNYGNNGYRPITPAKDGAKHMCAVCHRTELDNEELVFRYCSKCNGNFEYCNEHLYTHVHVK